MTGAELARLEALGAELERTGESFLKQCAAEFEINKLTAKLNRWHKAVAGAKAKDPNHELLGRARTIIAGFETELSGWRHAYLAAWRPAATIQTKETTMTASKTPGEFDFKKRKGENDDHYTQRMRQTGGGTKYDWKPSDGRGVRDTKTGGSRFPKQRKPFPG